MRQRMTLWLAAVGLVVVAVGLVIVAGNGGDDDESTGLPTLPIGAGSNMSDAGEAAADRAVAPQAADMTRLPGVTYVPGEGLPALGGEAPAYRLGGDVDAEAVGRLAEALGIDGEPAETDDVWHVDDGERALDVYGTEGSWSTYLVAPAVPADGAAGVDRGSRPSGSSASGDAGSEPVTLPAELSPEEIAKLCPAADPRAIDEQPAADLPAEGDDEGGGATGSAGAADLTTCEMPPVGEPLPTEPFEPPVRPEDLPPEDEARSIALDLLGATGVDADGAEVTVDDGITEWFVTVEPRIGELPAPGLSMYVGVGDEGTITMASGYLAEPEELGQYPLLDTTAALDRLNEQYAYAGPAVDRAATTTGAGSDAAAGMAAAEPAPEPALDPSSPATEPGIVTTEPVPPRDAGDDLPVLTVPPEPALPPDTVVPPDGSVAPPVEPQPDPDVTIGRIEPAPTPTVPIEAPPEVEVTDAELVLLTEMAWDGSGTYLVPGYRFTAEDESSPVVTAVVDDLVEPPPTDLPADDVPADGDVPADDVPADQPGTVDPDTPVSDEPTPEPATDPVPTNPEPRPAIPPTITAPGG